MQLLAILSELSDKELIRLEEFVMDSGRRGVDVLLRELKKYRSGKRKFNKEKVFEAVAGKPYSPQYDDDWKYWVRSLKDLLYQFLAEIEFRQKLREDYGLQEQWVMRALFRRRIDQVFEQEVEKLIKPGKKKFPLRHLLELYVLKDMHHQRYKPQDAHLSYDEHMALIEEMNSLELVRLAQVIRKNEVGKAALMRRREVQTVNVAATAAKTLELKRTEVIDLKEHEDQLCAYYRYHTDAQLLRGVERVEALIKAYQLLPELKDELEFVSEAILATLHNIASGYYIMGMYEEALYYTEEVWRVVYRKALEQFSPIYETKIRVLMALKRYQDAIDFLAREGHHLAMPGSKLRADISISYCYLFLGNTKSAIKQMMKYGVESNAVQVHNRYMYVIAAIIEDDLITAQRNLLNYKNSVDMDGKEDLQVTYKCFDSYLKIWNKGGDGRTEKLIKLNTEINRAIKPSLANMQPLLWLKEYLANKLQLEK